MDANAVEFGADDYVVGSQLSPTEKLKLKVRCFASNSTFTKL